uniref:FZ domain-containing protein n=1 Tax=Labrus bergylta TaxID=56723 RepID=A0A3Q3GM07_9LABR
MSCRYTCDKHQAYITCLSVFLLFQRPAFILPTIPSGVCQKISVPLCIGLPYTETVLPNLLGHVHQRDVDQAIQTFASLVQVECSPHLKPFLCSVFTPECQSGRPRPPCRTLCEQARFSCCEDLMHSFGVSWPEELQCNNLMFLMTGEL